MGASYFTYQYTPPVSNRHVGQNWMRELRLAPVCLTCYIACVPTVERAYTCVYVYMYVCLYVSSYVCIHVCICVYMYVCIHVYMYTCIYVFMYICVYVCMYICRRYACIFVYVFSVALDPEAMHSEGSASSLSCTARSDGCCTSHPRQWKQHPTLQFVGAVFVRAFLVPLPTLN